MIRDQHILDLNEELIIDNFAGGGGASHGIEMALGRHVDIAINHDRKAIAMHQANHPQTLHLCESVWDVDPVEVCKGRRVGLLWLSPDCKHFSKAKGGKPRSKKIRGLAWVALNWVQKAIQSGLKPPRVIHLENVEEFKTWCPLLPDGSLSTWRKGWFFQCFVGALRRRGYDVDWREERACDFGAATIRKRLYLIARCDGRPIVFPAARYGDPASKAFKAGDLLPWHVAAEHIDFSIRCSSIFLTKEEGRSVNVKRPLVKASLLRIAKGVKRHVMDAKEPFIVELTHQGNDGVAGLGKPIKTITGANRGEKGLVVPIMAYAQHGGACRAANGPSHTLAASRKDQNQLIVASVVKMRGAPATHAPGHPVTEPVHAISAQGTHHGLLGCYLAQHNGGEKGHQSVGHPLTNPSSTINAKGCQQQVVAVNLVKYYGTDQDPQLREPSHTIPTKDRFGLIECIGGIPPFTSEKEVAARRVAAFLRANGVQFEGEFAMVGPYVIWDIAMRMLVPRELFLLQGFTPDYIIDRGVEIDEKTGAISWIPLTKTDQVKMCGNSVCPPMAAALVAANVIDMAVWTDGERRRRISA